MAGVIQSINNNDYHYEFEDEDITHEMGVSSKKKRPKSSPSSLPSPLTSSNEPISILSRSISDYDACEPEQSVEFDPVQGNRKISYFVLDMTRFISCSLL